jgi:hypothetical protein
MKQPAKPLAPVDEETLVNVAVHMLAEFCGVTMPLPQPVPLQPENLEPVPAKAFSAIEVPTGNRAWQAVPQNMPGGEEVTDPSPLPAMAIVKATELPISVISFADGSAT